MNNEPSNLFLDLANLSVELMQESQHDHSAETASEQCPHCWTRKMAIDLMQYLWQPLTPATAKVRI